MEIVIETLKSVALFFIAAPLIGWALINCLWQLLDGLGVKVRKDRKVKCWIYTSLIVLLLSALISAFSRCRT